MPLFIEGKQVYELQDSFADIITTYPKFKDSASEFCSRHPHHCNPANLLYVNQREYAVTLPSDKIVNVLGSDDATTCHIIVIRHPGSGATGLAHLDGNGMEQGIGDILATVVELSIGYTDARLELHIFGGFCDERGESAKITKQILEISQKCTFEVHLVTACVTDLNDVIMNGRHWPIIYGIAVDVKTGEMFPATFADKGPDQALRSVYTLFSDHRVRNVYDHVRGTHVITPFGYKPWPQAAIWLQQPDSFIRQNMSTSPLVEPPYFEQHIRDALRWVLDHPKPALTVFPENKPREYQKDEEGRWTSIRQCAPHLDR